MSIVLGILTFVLILVSLFIVLVVLAQKSKDGGMGAALGGGAAEAAFGAETGNVLSKSTIYAAVMFFVLAFALYAFLQGAFVVLTVWGLVGRTRA